MYPFALEMGGRNQNTHLLRSGWAVGPAVGFGSAAAFGAEVSRSEALEAGLLMALLPAPLPLPPLEDEAPSLADFSAVDKVLVLAAEPRAESNGFPGVLGVFADDELPNDAKAPEPRPKALDALVVGDTRLPPGVKEANGFFPSDELSPPNRLKEVLRPDGLS